MIAIVTDLHANREAVAAVLAHARAQGATRYALLGDFVGYGADPAWVVDTVREHVAAGAIVVRGNHDAAVVRGPQRSMVPEARHVVAWTREQLSEQQLGFLAALPYTVTEGDVLFVHANAFAPSDWAYVDSREAAAESFEATACRITFCGHMHAPMLYHRSRAGKTGEFRPVPGVAIQLTRPRRWLAIPGACGQPRDGNPAACYALFDPARGTLTFQRVPYDHATAAAKIVAAGLPGWLAQRLHDGR